MNTTTVLASGWFEARDGELARVVLQRGIGLVYLLAFVATLRQFRPLLGTHGLEPVPRFLAVVPFRRAPSVFHLRYSDRLVEGVAVVGILGAAAIVVGLVARAPVAVSMLVWLVLWVFYLSLVNVGQTFYGFGWETMLCEAGFLAVFLGSTDTAPPVVVLWLFRWLTFRLEFGAGLIKLRGDPCWRDLTCLQYHHETQPLPNRFSWWFHRLPAPLHRVEVLANHVAQLVVPVLLFAPQPVAGAAAVVIIVTQGWLVLSGNFAWLNALTIVVAAAALPDGFLDPLLPAAPTPGATPGWFATLVVALGVVVVVLSWRPVRNLLSSQQRMNTSFDPLRLVNSYGAFGHVTRERNELVVEGTDAVGTPDGVVWKAYEFKAKPGDPARRPRQVAPYHLRLDWLMWFAAMRPPQAYPWLRVLLRRLLEGDAATLRLLGTNPFPGAPPRAVRVLVYRYRFTTGAERKATGQWWHRTLLGTFVEPVVLTPTATGAAPAVGGGTSGRSVV